MKGEGSWGTRSSRSLGDNLELGGIYIEQSVITRWRVMLTATVCKQSVNLYSKVYDYEEHYSLQR